MREETTRQLNRAVVDDWNYQTNFKQKRQEEEKLAEMAAAYHEKQVGDKTISFVSKQNTFSWGTPLKPRSDWAQITAESQRTAAMER